MHDRRTPAGAEVAAHEIVVRAALADATAQATGVARRRSRVGLQPAWRTGDRSPGDRCKLALLVGGAAGACVSSLELVRLRQISCLFCSLVAAQRLAHARLGGILPKVRPVFRRARGRAKSVIWSCVFVLCSRTSRSASASLPRSRLAPAPARPPRPRLLFVSCPSTDPGGNTWVRCQWAHLCVGVCSSAARTLVGRQMRRSGGARRQRRPGGTPPRGPTPPAANRWRALGRCRRRWRGACALVWRTGATVELFVSRLGTTRASGGHRALASNYLLPDGMDHGDRGVHILSPHGMGLGDRGIPIRRCLNAMDVACFFYPKMFSAEMPYVSNTFPEQHTTACIGIQTQSEAPIDPYPWPRTPPSMHCSSSLAFT